eukprot:14282-Rhodomonas_salina.1
MASSSRDSPPPARAISPPPPRSLTLSPLLFLSALRSSLSLSLLLPPSSSRETSTVDASLFP